MFSFFHRKKKIVLDCFTANTFAYRYAPIVRATHSIPPWWKNLPNIKLENVLTEDPSLTQNMKKCYGFIELYKRSLMLEHWTDMMVKVSKTDYSYSLLQGSPPTNHPKFQFMGAFDNYHHMKLNSPWIFREISGLHFLLIGADYSLDKYNFKIVPGVVEFNVNNAININTMVPALDQPYEFNIPVGQPLLHIVPLSTDYNIEFKCHLVTVPELDKIITLPSTFLGHRVTVLRDKFVKNRAKQTKCPFS